MARTSAEADICSCCTAKLTSAPVVQQAPLNRVLSPAELKSKVFLVRRVGVAPYGLLPLEMFLPAEYGPPEECRSHIIFG